MFLEILCVEPIYPQYSGVLETCLAMRYWFFEVLGSESVKGFWQIPRTDRAKEISAFVTPDILY